MSRAARFPRSVCVRARGRSCTGRPLFFLFSFVVANAFLIWLASPRMAGKKRARRELRLRYRYCGRAETRSARVSTGRRLRNRELVRLGATSFLFSLLSCRLASLALSGRLIESRWRVSHRRTSHPRSLAASFTPTSYLAGRSFCEDRRRGKKNYCLESFYGDSANCAASVTSCALTPVSARRGAVRGLSRASWLNGTALYVAKHETGLTRSRACC